MIFQWCILILAILQLSLVTAFYIRKLVAIYLLENSLLEDRGYIKKCKSKNQYQKSSLQVSF